MLEILLVMFVTRKIGSMAEANGRKPTGFKVLAAVMWFGGEFMGAIVGAIIAAIAGGSVGVDPPLLVIYPFALAGAALGAGSAFLIVLVMGPVTTTSTSSVPPSFPKIG